MAFALHRIRVMNIAEKSRVVVTGVGPVSALGSGRRQFWDALVAGQSGISRITQFDASRFGSRIAAEVRGFRLEEYLEHGRSLSRRLPRPVQFALAAAELALRDAGFRAGDADPERIGVCIGTAAGNSAHIFDAHRKWLADDLRLPPELAFNAFNHAAACVVSATFDFRGPVQTISAGCNSGLDAMGAALRWIQLGEADAVLAIGTDCEVAPEFLALLEASGSLSTRYNHEPAKASRPFDRDRDGNVIGEGAAALLLESEEHARRRGVVPLARFAAHAVTASGKNRRYSHSFPEMDSELAVRALRTATQSAGWAIGDVDLISANGSSSAIYDALESHAFAEFLGPHVSKVPVHSIKSMLGQHGAGSSALQAAAACLSIRDGIVPPTINYDNPDPACAPLRIVTQAGHYRPARVLIHAMGLGGFYSSCGAFEAPEFPEKP